jgi:hypothetical protein
MKHARAAGSDPNGHQESVAPSFFLWQAAEKAGAPVASTSIATMPITSSRSWLTRSSNFGPPIEQLERLIGWLYRQSGNDPAAAG